MNARDEERLGEGVVGADEDGFLGPSDACPPSGRSCTGEIARTVPLTEHEVDCAVEHSEVIGMHELWIAVDCLRDSAFATV